MLTLLTRLRPAHVRVVEAGDHGGCVRQSLRARLLCRAELTSMEPPTRRQPSSFSALDIVPVHQPAPADLLCSQLATSAPVVNRAAILPGGGGYSFRRKIFNTLRARCPLTTLASTSGLTADGTSRDFERSTPDARLQEVLGKCVRCRQPVSRNESTEGSDASKLCELGREVPVQPDGGPNRAATMHAKALRGSCRATHETSTRRVICPLLSQNVLLLARNGSSGAG
jgi:hypothetical protein